MLIKYLILLLSIIVLSADASADESCCFNTNKAYRSRATAAEPNNLRITLSKFNDLKELKFNCKEPIDMSILQLLPNKPIILDNSLEIKNLQINDSLDDGFAFVFTNFKGFDLNSNPFGQVKINKQFQCYYFQIDSKFDFYLNNTLITSNNCKPNLPNLSFTRQARVLILDKINMNSAETTCPIIFKNTNFVLLSIQMKLSLIYKNSLTFQNLTFDQDLLNCTIYQTVLSVYRSNLNTKLFNKHVFEKLKVLVIYGVINQIEDDTFKSLKELHLLKIQSQNVRNLFVFNNKWLQYLNQDMHTLNLNQIDEINMFALIIYQSIENVTFYNYPDEDFCLFKEYPHNRLVIPILKPNSKSICSCTELFLIQYSEKYSSFLNYLDEKIVFNDYMYQYEVKVEKNLKLHKCFNESFDLMISKCNFQKRLENCKINKKVKDGEIDVSLNVYIYDFMQISGLIEFIFVKNYANLIILIISLLIIILMIIIITSMKSTNNKSYMYIYLNIHCIFNFIFCLIAILNFILGIDCSVDDVFCVEKYESLTFKYTKIILIKLIGNSVRTCSNLAHISFCLSRYKKMKGLDYLWIKCLNNISTKLYIVLIVAFSILLNLYRYFQFSYSEMNPTFFKFYWLSNFFNQDSFYDYKETFTANSEFTIINIFQYLNIIFSDITYILATTIIDVLLFKLVKEQMAAKRLILTHSSLTAPQTNEKLSAEQRVSRMIILNGVNYFLFRLPLALIHFYSFFFRYDKLEEKHLPNMISYIVCRRYKFCKNLSQIFYFLYLLSYLVQFFIFYKLDRNFKESTLGIKKRIKNFFKMNNTNPNPNNNNNSRRNVNN